MVTASSSGSVCGKSGRPFRYLMLLLVALCGSEIVFAQATFPVSFVARIDSLLPSSPVAPNRFQQLTVPQTLCLAVADFNSDGKLDVATCGNANDVWVSLGNGDGTFQPAVTYTAGTNYPLSLMLADFNGDKKPDLIVINGDSTVSVLLGNGDGTFQSQVVTAISANVQNLVGVGDFNGDGKADLVIPVLVPQDGDSEPAIMQGNGDGTFQAPVMSGGAVASPTSVQTADFNGDGKLDLIWGLTVFLGNGSGTLQAAINGSTTNECCDLVGDFNNDGKPDVSTAGKLFLGNGDGTFDSGQYLPCCGSPVIAADFNGDGNLDLLTDGGTVELGNGDGTFNGVVGEILPVGTFGVGDFNGDGTLDVVAAVGSGVLETSIGQGNGNFLSDTVLGACGSRYCVTNDVVVGDLNNDGIADLVFVSGLTDVEGGVAVTALLGNGNATFKVLPAFNAGNQGLVATAALADFNKDGKLDLAVAVGPALGILLGDGDGTFEPLVTYGSDNPIFVASGDFNGDGKMDVVTVDGAGTSSVFLGNGDGTFGFPSSFSLSGGSPTALVVADFNHDGKLDLAVNNGTVLLGNGDGTFQSPVAAFPSGGSIAIGDFNNEGNLDIAEATSSGLAIMLGNGDGTFGSPVYYGFAGGQIAVADFNHDGKLDIAVGNQTVGDVEILVGKGDGTFQAETPYFVSTLFSNGVNLAAVDVNGDGYPDLVSGTMSLLLNRSSGADSWITPDLLTFASQNVGSRTGQDIFLTNIGQQALTISSTTFTGADAGDFSIINYCDSTLPAGAKCHMEVDFIPQGAGTRTATLIIKDNGTGSPHTIALSGTAVATSNLGLGVPSGGSSSVTVSAGETAKYTLSIGGAGFSGTATLACSGSPTGATCTVPASVSVSATTASQFPVSVSTTAAMSGALVRQRFAPFPWLWAIGIFGVVILPVAATSSGRQRIPRRYGRGLAIGLILLISSCGGGGGNGGTTSTSGGSGATPAGSYTLTVTATSGSMSSSVQLKLTVQ